MCFFAFQILDRDKPGPMARFSIDHVTTTYVYVRKKEKWVDRTKVEELGKAHVRALMPILQVVANSVPTHGQMSVPTEHPQGCFFPG